MVDFLRDVVVVLALLMSLFALAYHTPIEPESTRMPMPGSLVQTGTITVAPAVNTAK